MADSRFSADGLLLAADIIEGRARGLRMELENKELACRLMDEFEADVAALRRVAVILQRQEIVETPF